MGFKGCAACLRLQRESFASGPVAEVMNQYTFPMLVDVVERDDLDKRFTHLSQIALGGGGWPLLVWLIDEDTPFHLSSYLPPRELKTLVEAIGRGYHQNVATHRDRGALLKVASKSPVAMTPRSPRSESFYEALPWDSWFESRDEKARMSLSALLFSATHDPLDGGFFRYSAAGDWDHPHLEKMASGNFLLARQYLRFGKTFHEERWVQVGLATLAFVEKYLAHSSGLWVHSLDSAAAYYGTALSRAAPGLSIVAIGEGVSLIKFSPGPAPSQQSLESFRRERATRRFPERNEVVSFEDSLLGAEAYAEAFFVTREDRFRLRAQDVLRAMDAVFPKGQRLSYASPSAPAEMRARAAELGRRLGLGPATPKSP